MISLGLLVILVAVVAVVVLVRRPARPPELELHLSDWVAAGLIDEPTRAAIGRFEAEHATVGAPVPVLEPASVPVVQPTVAQVRSRPAFAGVVEALGYLGGVLGASGVVLLVANYWTDLGVGGRLAISGLTAAALIGGGWAVPEANGPAMARLRSFLWTLGTAAVAVFAAVLGDELGAPSPPSRVTAITAGAVALTSGLMWWGGFRPVQQFVTLAAGVVAVGATFDLLAGHVGVGTSVWVVGAALVALGWRRLTPVPVIDVAVGAVAMGVGSIIAIGSDPGARLLVVVGTGLLLVALVLVPNLIRGTASIVVLAVVGGFALVQTAPPAVAHFAKDAGVPTGLVIWLAGAAVLALLAGSMLPDRVALAPVGALGLLVNVPWAISWFFPGEGRVPLLISVSGVLIIAVAVLMARLGHRFGSELGRHPLPRG